ncbi:hypothetical protein Dsin_019719 [Dipteronia sinensis]|uniref:BRCT domain-containing protein n=1 Tax=Dipteronia sinensis TaxID=43782 RepID=A0AAE0A942_9ROSI|nr:hypothetical protein Dsin_019719 [Dipteronia sinensis]
MVLFVRRRGIEQIVARYFSELFKFAEPSDEQWNNILDSVPTKLSQRSRELMDMPFTAAEVKKEVFDMFPTKAPGIDELSSLIHRRFLVGILLVLGVDVRAILSRTFSLLTIACFSPELQVGIASLFGVFYRSMPWNQAKLLILKNMLFVFVAIQDSNQLIRVGSIVRNSGGQVLASSVQRFSACLAGATSILRGLRFAVDSGLLPTVLESDAKWVVDLINSNETDFTGIGVVICDSVSLKN